MSTRRKLIIGSGCLRRSSDVRSGEKVIAATGSAMGSEAHVMWYGRALNV